MLECISKPECQITTEDLRFYLDTYQRRGTVSKVTLDNVRRILSSFFAWLEDEDYIVKSPVRRIHKVKTGKTVKETYSDESLELISKDFEEIRYIDISSINNQSKRVTGYVELPIDETPSRAQQVLEKGDILISTVRPNLQNIAVNPYSEENVVASTGFCVLRCEKCLPEYIWGVITSEAFTNAMCEQASGISYPAVRDSDILQYLIPDAPIEIQEQFAAFVRQSDKSKYNALQAMRL